MEGCGRFKKSTFILLYLSNLSKRKLKNSFKRLGTCEKDPNFMYLRVLCTRKYIKFGTFFEWLNSDYVSIYK
jgi:hypothetical protein